VIFGVFWWSFRWINVGKKQQRRMVKGLSFLALCDLSRFFVLRGVGRPLEAIWGGWFCVKRGRFSTVG